MTSKSPFRFGTRWLSLPFKSVNFTGKVGKGVFVAAGDGQVGAGLGKCAGKVLAKTAAGSSYQCYFAG